MRHEYRASSSRIIHRYIASFLEAQDLNPSDGTFVVGVSGGSDSVCLLHALSLMRTEFDLRLHAAHLNHGLRGSESVGDADYVAALCSDLGVTLTTRRIDVAAYRKDQGSTLEEAARECRYSFFAEVARATRSAAVFLGHTSDDQAETILLHMIRGAGLVGISGMRPLAQRPVAIVGSTPHFLTVARPLLESSRSDTHSYCSEQALNPRSDSSNLSRDPTRNQIRLDIIPQLQKLNPKITQALARLGKVSREATTYFDKEAAKTWPLIVRRDEMGMTLNRAQLCNLPRPVAGHTLRLAVSEMRAGQDLDLSFDLLDRMLRLASGPPGKLVALPGGLLFSTAYEVVRLDRLTSIPTPSPSLPMTPLAIPGNTYLPGWLVRATTNPTEGVQPITNGSLTALLDPLLSERPLWVRARQKGDRFQPAGMTGKKKLQDLLVDSKVPRNARDAVPLLCDNEGILWVVGHRIAARAALPSGAKTLLQIDFVASDPTHQRSRSRARH